MTDGSEMKETDVTALSRREGGYRYYYLKYGKMDAHTHSRMSHASFQQCVNAVSAVLRALLFA